MSTTPAGQGSVPEPAKRWSPADEDRDSVSLVGRVKRGDTEAVAQIYCCYAPPVRSFLSKLVGRDEADALTQEVFARALVGLARFDPRGPTALRSWLFVVARNCARDHLAERSRLDVRDPTVVSLLVDRGDFAQDDALLGSLARLEFERLVACLPKRQRVVLSLRCLLHLSDARIAELLNIEERAVTQAAYKGLCTLRARHSQATEFAFTRLERTQHSPGRHPFSLLVRLPARMRANSAL
jgi:RNA polymerase sigma-70 factor (ECF subfamily)